MPDKHQPGRFKVADWEVDFSTNRLRRKDREIKVETRVMAVLQFLVQHANQPITRADLEQAVWGNTIVGYDALTRCIAQLRKILEDNSRDPRYIETISKKGYRLIAPVAALPLNTATRQDTLSSTPTTLPPLHWNIRRKLALPVILIVVLLVLIWLQPGVDSGVPEAVLLAKDALSEPQENEPAIVVLPFTSIDSDPSRHHFSEGITADLTTALSRAAGLLVIAPPSARSFSGNPARAQNAARELKARYVLTGSVREESGRIRVNVHLLDSDSELVLWSEKYDRELDSLLEVQDEITQNIIQALSIKVTEEERRRIAHRYTISLPAYEAFLKGQSHYMRHTAEDNRLAQDFFQKAIERDSTFARAYSAMALALAAEHRYAWGDRSGKLLQRALQLATQAISFEPDLPQAHWVLAYVYLFRHDYQQAATAAERSIRLNPSYADGYLTLAICKLHENNPETALRLIRKAMRINPAYPAAYASILGQAYFFSGHYAQAVPVLREAIERNNNLLTAHIFLVATLQELEMQDEAEWASMQLQNVRGDFSTRQLAGILPTDEADAVKRIRNLLIRSGLQ